MDIAACGVWTAERFALSGELWGGHCRNCLNDFGCSREVVFGCALQVNGVCAVRLGAL